ncbi:MAG: serine/threonine-protein kinase [Myxococcaceae bacterium]
MGDYQVLRKLADGSAAEVFLACEGHSSTSRVVLEVIRPELTTDFAVYGRFLDEAKDSQARIHPNLLRHRTTGCAPDGRLYAVTEPIDGEHLGSLLVANGPLSPAEVVRLVVPLCEALEYLHARGKMHGHLRPSNVFLTRTEAGISPKLLDTSLSLLRPGKSIATPASLVLVEPEYLSPERIRGRRASPLSDVYGLGVLMYEALTGKPPFTSPDPAFTRRLHLESEPPALPPSCERLAPIVLRCLAKNPTRRYPSIKAVRQALSWHDGASPSPGARRLSTGAPDGTVDIPVDDLDPLTADSLVMGEPVGEVLGSYELEDLLGQGGMGRVFLARHVKLGRRVALKVLRPELAADPHHLQRFFQEARAVNRVKHEHIVQIFDFVEEPKEEGGRVYCVMEPLIGKSLKDLAREGPMAIARAVGIVRQVCAALQAAHDVGVIHRDVKPDNIFLVDCPGPRDFAKVLDFGIAKLEAAAGDPTMANTRSGMVVGTPSYMAPEQAIGDEVDGRADVYSLGTVLFALLAGKRPFEAASMGALLARLVTRPAPPLPEATPRGEPIPLELRQLVMRCLAKKPADRVQSMAGLAEALLPFAAAEAGAAALDLEGIAAGVSSPSALQRKATEAAVATAKARRLAVKEEAAPGLRRARWPWLLAIALAAAGFALWERSRPEPEPAPPAKTQPAQPDTDIPQGPALEAPREIELDGPPVITRPKKSPKPGRRR